MKLAHLLLSASVLAVTAAPVFAEGNTIFSGNSGVTLKFSGQINRGILLTDDGVDTESFFVDNDNSSSRFKISAEGAISEGLRAGRMKTYLASPSAGSLLTSTDLAVRIACAMIRQTSAGSPSPHLRAWRAAAKPLTKFMILQHATQVTLAATKCPAASLTQ